MLSFALWLVLHGFYMTLRISGGGSFPRPLSASEERDALERKAAGDRAARDLLIEHNLRLVAHVIKKYYTSAADQEDLISIGTIGLIKAVDSFDHTKNIRLATYAGRCIENEILMHFRALRKTAGELSLNDELDSDGDGDPLVLGDTIADSSEEMIDRLGREEEQRKLLECMAKTLDPREHEILSLRYGLGEQKPLTQREIASKYGISRSYVSRLEKKALDKLRSAFVSDLGKSNS